MKNYILKIDKLRIKKVNKLFYKILAKLCIPFFVKKYNVTSKIIDDPRKEEKPYILLSNHCCAYDFANFLPFILPDTFNILAAYSEFFRHYQYTLFKMGRVIPKKRNYPDIRAVEAMIKIVKKDKGNLLMFPEGVTTLNGANQPVGNGTGKLLKLLNVPVYIVINKFTALAFPKFDEKLRKGKVEVEFKKLFSKEDLEKLSAEEIEDKVNEALYFDAYEENKKEQISFKVAKKDHIAKNITDELYLCPKCHEEFKNVVSEDDVIECSSCHNKIKVDDKYNLIPLEDSLAPYTIKKWHDLERIIIRKEIESNLDFEYEVEVILGMLDIKHLLNRSDKTSLKVGDGKLIMSRKGITYKGKRYNKDFEFTMSTNELPTFVMCYDCNILHMFYKNELYEFRFLHKGYAVKTQLIAEELHRVNNGKWQNFKFFEYKEENCFKKNEE